MPLEMRDTGSFRVIRLRRLEYPDDQLQEWAAFIQEEVGRGQDCYVYCRHREVVEPWKWADRLRD